MIICVCHRVSDRDINRAVQAGCDSFAELQQHTRVGTACGRCIEHAQDSFAELGGGGGCGHCAGAGRCGASPAQLSA
ncbi:(2Fe-2S)-binding protein [Rubrivivax sp. A210]|uniref:(2Fe-2S)-binding protein n=1 Tax=Rubrivivax sp. A210 TaxID=2772301 RepID=UPI0019197598|nr:(2Fe-2S)-binding protein [Rubrivivax sp. A210]CAD5372443.1 (2Fe-2S)-binding protein [Rubrivivax sp. A210]